MLKLMLKDLYIQRYILLIMLPAIVIYLTMGRSPIFIGVLFSVVMAMNNFSIDEKKPIHVLLNSLPYTRKEIVASKYVGAIFYTLLVIVVLFGGYYFLNDWDASLAIVKDLALVFALSMIMIAFILPFSYKYKSQYLLIGSIILFALYMVAYNLLEQNLNTLIGDLTNKVLSLPELQLYLGSGVLVLLLFAASWMLSNRVYGKKVF